MVLQLLALPLIFWSLLLKRRGPTSNPGKQLLWIAVLGILVVVMQLVPLPPALWTSLPGREFVVEGFLLLQLPLPWLPVSLAPSKTIASLLWLLPALAVLLGILKAGAFRSKWIASAILAVTLAGVVVGTLQASGAAEWHLYTITNFGTATGFFANSNHMATLLLVSIPFVSALAIGELQSRRRTQRSSAILVVLAGLLGAILVGLAVNGSVAGLCLSLPVICASLLMAASLRKRLLFGIIGLLCALAAGAVYLVFATSMGSDLVGENAQTYNTRYESFSVSLPAVREFLPVGSGVGTFADIYKIFEDADQVTKEYMNHVHNDYIEVALETGALGIGLMLTFLVWFVHRAVQIWKRQDSDLIPKAATIALGAILVHSLVDYPLRTAALSAVFAACCALLAEARPRMQGPSASTKQDDVRHLSSD
jgi:O-antigen ligase